MKGETYVDDEIALSGGKTMRTAAADAQAAAPALIAQIRAKLDSTSWGEGREADAFEKAHREVRSGLDVAEKVVDLIWETAHNVVTGIEDQVSVDLVAKSLIDGVPLGEVTTPQPGG